jgi:hypothetical protein
MVLIALLWMTSAAAAPVPSTLSEACQQDLAQIKKGMTRQELESRAHVDGGSSKLFRKERYVLDACGVAVRGFVFKIDVAFKPAQWSDTFYSWGQWSIPEASPDDTIWAVSAPYWQVPYLR